MNIDLFKEECDNATRYRSILCEYNSHGVDGPKFLTDMSHFNLTVFFKAIFYGFYKKYNKNIINLKENWKFNL